MKPARILTHDVAAQTEFMDQIAANNKMREDVNIWRREILFLTKANNSIQSDINRLQKHNLELEQVCMRAAG